MTEANNLHIRFIATGRGLPLRTGEEEVIMMEAIDTGTSPLLASLIMDLQSLEQEQATGDQGNIVFGSPLPKGEFNQEQAGNQETFISNKDMKMYST